MALFSRLRKSAATPANALDDIARALLTPAVVVAAADGKLEASEIDQIGAMCAFNPVFQRVGGARTTELIKDLLAQFSRSEFGEMLEQTAAKLDQPMRETAMCFAIRVSIADGHLDEMEHKTLVVFASKLGIPPEEYNRMLDVLVMLQRYPQAA